MPQVLTQDAVFALDHIATALAGRRNPGGPGNAGKGLGSLLDDVLAGGTPSGLYLKEAVRVATTAALPANTRVGDVITADANGALGTIDGVTVAAPDRVLVKNEGTGANNGIYEVTAVGGAGAKWSMKRTGDFNASADVRDGATIPVAEGTANGDSAWQLTTNAVITLDTTALTFTRQSVDATSVIAALAVAATAVAFNSQNLTTLGNVGTFHVKEIAAVQAELRLFEATNNGTNKVAVKPVAALAADRTFTLPDADVTISELTAENTDCEVGIDIVSGVTGSGTWTPTMQAAGPRLRRTAAAQAAEDRWIKVGDYHRTAASRGIKPLTLAVNYEITTEAADDVRFELYKVTLAADLASRTRTLLGGDANGHYDLAHDTAAERGAIANHRATVTLPTPAYVALDEQLWLRVFVNDATGGGAVVDVTAAKLGCAEQFNDVA